MTVAGSVAASAGPVLPGLPDARLLAGPGLERPEWLRLRRTGIGGSDIAAICGLNTRTSPLTVYYDKRGELPPEGESEEARWGHRMEPVVAEVFAEETGIKVHPSPGTLAHRDKRWMMANPDRLAGDPDAPAILEIKTRSAPQLPDWEEGIPDGPALQVQWYMAVTGAVCAYVAALIGGNTLRIYRADRDDALVDTLVARAARFWDDVQTGRPPPPDDSAATRDTLTRMTDIASREHHADPVVVEPLLARREALKEELKNTERELRGVENTLIAELRGADTCVVNGQVAYTYRPAGGLATKRLRTDHPDLWEKYQRPASQFHTDAFKRDHPDLYTAYRGRSLKVPAASKGGVR